MNAHNCIGRCVWGGGRGERILEIKVPAYSTVGDDTVDK